MSGGPLPSPTAAALLGSGPTGAGGLLIDSRYTQFERAPIFLSGCTGYREARSSA